MEVQHIETQFQHLDVDSERILGFNPDAFINSENMLIGQEMYGMKNHTFDILSRVTQQLINIPIGIEYQLLDLKSLEVLLNGGISINASRNYSGDFLDQDLSIINIVQANQNGYLSNQIGLSYLLGFSFNKTINRAFSIELAPAYRIGAFNYYNDNFRLSNNKHFLGGQIGLRYHFNKS